MTEERPKICIYQASGDKWELLYKRCQHRSQEHGLQACREGCGEEAATGGGLKGSAGKGDGHLQQHSTVFAAKEPKVWGGEEEGEKGQGLGFFLFFCFGLGGALRACLYMLVITEYELTILNARLRYFVLPCFVSKANEL